MPKDEKKPSLGERVEEKVKGLVDDFMDALDRLVNPAPPLVPIPIPIPIRVQKPR